jgi:hypothetical protein
MAKPGDLIGKSGGSGFGPAKPANPFVPPKPKGEGETTDHSATKLKPAKDSKQPKGKGGPSGGAPTTVRPKV